MELTPKGREALSSTKKGLALRDFKFNHRRRKKPFKKGGKIPALLPLQSEGTVGEKKTLHKKSTNRDPPAASHATKRVLYQRLTSADNIPTGGKSQKNAPVSE